MENTKRCAACGYDAQMDARFCPHCGGSQFYGPAVRCPVCGANVPQGRYCAHCGADLQNPGAQVWHNCMNCGNPVHITHANCLRCGAVSLPPVKPKQPKKRSNAWLALLLIPVLILVVGIVIGIGAYLENEMPQMNWPGVTTMQQQNAGTTATRPTLRQPSQSATQPTIPAKPTQTEPAQEPSQPTQTPTEPAPTEPTQTPTEPKPTEPSSNIPSAFADNHYLAAVGDGYCETMTGDVVVLFLFVNDPTDGWTDVEMEEAEAALLDELRTLLTEAEAYGAELNMSYAFGSVTIGTEFSETSTYWKEEAMTRAGFYDGYMDQRELEAYYGADQVPVVFIVDEPGRSYANSYSSGKGFESLVILQKDYCALRHEMCHLFGARDMYFPQETVAAAKQYLPNGIMYGDCEGAVDALTAFTIGWTDQLTDAAIAFLWATNGLTEEYIEEAKAQDQLTGYGTKYFDGGHYIGYMVGGVFHGEGTCYWDDGSVFTGTWVNGVRTGKGTMTDAEGNSYTGDFVDNHRHGQGIYTWVDGTVYSGTWVNGQQSGYGEIRGTDGYSYKGNWEDGQYHGAGTQTWANGDSYTGDFAEGQRHGKGTYTWADGDYYTGDFVEGQRTGYGERYYAYYGTRYVGDFVNGKRHGWGTYYYADGTTYTGRWENDARVD